MPFATVMSPAVATLTLLLCASAAVALKLPPWQWNDMDNEASHKVSFEFYSRENRDTPGDVVTVSDLPDDLESFDPQRPTKVLVHGWHGRQAHAQALKKAGKCSHNRAYYLFEESILLNDTLLALPAAAAGHGTHHADPCSEVDTSADTVPMGLSTPRSARGVFCLSTRAEEPFGYGAESPIPMMVKPTWRQTASMWLKFLRLKMPHSA
ncbi:hypothetical protein FOCC_FOCC000760 [Frankliniella occidentalis]|nr:hypothetical protein FOCC_FOCC000760 [Frankliniella occidentalis]